MAVPNPIQLDQVVDHVLDCMCSALTAVYEELHGDHGWGGPSQPGCPCLSCKVPGEPTLCCPGDAPNASECFGGQLTVRPVRLFPTRDFPRQDVTVSTGCDTTSLVAELAVTLVRCMPQVSDDGEDNLPTCDQLAHAARHLNVDMLTLYRAATCCVPSMPGRHRPLRTVVASHVAIRPEACFGSTLTLWVDLGGQCCPELPIPDPDE